MSAKKLGLNARVALKENTKYRGLINNILAPYNKEDPTLLSVQWDKGGCYIYLEESLIPEKDVVEKKK